MEVSITGARIYFEIPILGGIPITETIVNSWLVMLAIIGLCLFLTHDLKVRNVSKRQVVAEMLVTTAQNFVNTNMGEKFAHYGPFVAALFASSLLSNLLSLIGMFPPTSDLSTTLAWAVLVFMLITATKIRTSGVLGYMKGFTQPIFVLTPFNILSELATPISMAFRHFGKLLLHLRDLIAVHKIVHEPAKRAILIENGSRRGDGVMPGIEVHHAGIG